jgi:hypothetical protein
MGSGVEFRIGMPNQRTNDICSRQQVWIENGSNDQGRQHLDEVSGFDGEGRLLDSFNGNRFPKNQKNGRYRTMNDKR